MLALSAGIAAFNCNVKAWETPFALADKVAGCVVGTDDTVAAKPALLAYLSLIHI